MLEKEIDYDAKIIGIGTLSLRRQRKENLITKTSDGRTA